MYTVATVLYYTLWCNMRKYDEPIKLFLSQTVEG